MDIQLNNKCKESFIQWMQAHPFFSRQLRQALLQYVKYELRADITPVWLPEFLAASQELFDILDSIYDTAGKQKQLKDVSNK